MDTVRDTRGLVCQYQVRRVATHRVSRRWHRYHLGTVGELQGHHGAPYQAAVLVQRVLRQGNITYHAPLLIPAQGTQERGNPPLQDSSLALGGTGDQRQRLRSE